MFKETTPNLLKDILLRQGNKKERERMEQMEESESNTMLRDLENKKKDAYIREYLKKKLDRLSANKFPGESEKPQ